MRSTIRNVAFGTNLKLSILMIFFFYHVQNVGKRLFVGVCPVARWPVHCRPSGGPQIESHRLNLLYIPGSAGIFPISYVNIIVDCATVVEPYKNTAVTVHENLKTDTYHKVGRQGGAREKSYKKGGYG